MIPRAHVTAWRRHAPWPSDAQVEINSREHFSVLGMQERRFDVQSLWFGRGAAVLTYHLDELLGTKLRALYQRKKGRDLFDLWWADRHDSVDFDRVVHCFREYLEHGGHRVSRAELQANLSRKIDDPAFTADLQPLLAPGVDWNLESAARLIAEEIAPRLHGKPWKGLGESGSGEN